MSLSAISELAVLDYANRDYLNLKSTPAISQTKSKRKSSVQDETFSICHFPDRSALDTMSGFADNARQVISRSIMHNEIAKSINSTASSRTAVAGLFGSFSFFSFNTATGAGGARA
jgi:hypothetical protein